MSQDRISHGGELTVMEIWRLIRRAPQPTRNEFPVPGEKAHRASRLVHVQRFLVRIIRPVTHVVQLQIRERRHVHHARGVRFQTRPGQIVSRQVHAEGWSLVDPQISRRIIRIGLCKNPSLVVERQARHMAARAPTRIVKVYDAGGVLVLTAIVKLADVVPPKFNATS